MTKKLLAILLAFTMLFAFTSCFGNKEKEGDTSTTDSLVTEEDVFEETKENVTKEDKTIPEVTTEKKPDLSKGEFTKEDIIEIYLKNKNVWILEEEYVYGHQYFFIDLDFDGIYEIASIYCEGTGIYSRTAFYKINKKTGEVYRLADNSDQRDGAFDLTSTGKYEPKLFKNKQTGEMVYLASDYLRVMYGESASFFGTLKFIDNQVIMEDAFLEYTYSGDTPNSSGEVIEYSVMSNREFVQVTEEEYHAERNKFLSQYKDMNLKLYFFDGETFNKADSATQKNMLLKGYNGFSYNK